MSRMLLSRTVLPLASLALLPVPRAVAESPSPAGVAARPAPATLDPIEVAPPTRVVVAAAESAATSLGVAIAEGHRVMANPAEAEFFVPLELHWDVPAGLEVTTTYPAGAPYEVPGTGSVVSCYHGSIDLDVRVHANEDVTPGEYVVEGVLVYQACHRHACLMPAQIPVRLSLTVRP